MFADYVVVPRKKRLSNGLLSPRSKVQCTSLFKFQPSSASENQVSQQKQMIPSERDKPAGLELSDFLPVSGLWEMILSVPVATCMHAWPTDWLSDCLTDRLIVWLTVWLSDWLSYQHTDWLIHCLNVFLSDSVSDYLFDLLTNQLQMLKNIFSVFICRVTIKGFQSITMYV